MSGWEPVSPTLSGRPVILIHGPRQCGKTTLARTVGEPLGHQYFSFDDNALLTAAGNDPAGFAHRLPPKAILDEVQRVPEIFTALKATIDRRLARGRLILTGPANVLFVPRLADSLAGRIGILRLHPLAQCEIEQSKPRFLDLLFCGGFRTGIAAPLHRELAAGQTARLVNVADLAARFELSRQTIHEYVTVLERVFLRERLPPWHTNRLSRLVKRPKLHMGDTGVACALLGVDAASLDRDRSLLGALLETFVLQELRRQASARPAPVEFHHFRDRDDFEVDLVLDDGPGRIAGVEVKATATVHERDLRGLRTLHDAAGTRFVSGVVLYDGRCRM